MPRLARSYAVGHPLVTGGEEYIPGTDSVGYALMNWPYALNPLASPAGKEALAVFQMQKPKRVVGHSFGALIADALTPESFGYGSPLPIRHGLSNMLDPVSAFAGGRKRAAAGHSLSSYAP